MKRVTRYLFVSLAATMLACLLLLPVARDERPVAAATPPPAVSGGARIDEPQAGAVVRGTVRITGTASVPNFQRYVIGIKWPGSNSFNDIAGGNQPVVNGLLYEGHTNARDCPDGVYTSRLRTVKIDGNYDEVTVSVRVDNSSTPTPTTTPTRAPTPTPAFSPTPIVVITPVVIGVAPTPTPAATRPPVTPTPLFGIDVAKIVDPTPWIRAFTTGAVLAVAVIAFVIALFIARGLLRWRP